MAADGKVDANGDGERRGGDARRFGVSGVNVLTAKDAFVDADDDADMWAKAGRVAASELNSISFFAMSDLNSDMESSSDETGFEAVPGVARVSCAFIIDCEATSRVGERIAVRVRVASLSAPEEEE